MIIPGMSEDKILEELVIDRKIIANEAKKIAKKHISCFLRQGRDGIDEDYEYDFNFYTNRNNNKWSCIILVNMVKKPYWRHFAACMVESDNAQRDYYLLRGLSNNNPYFVRVTSHAMKRFKERGIEETLNIETDTNGADYAGTIFQKGEVVTWLKVVDPKFWKIVSPFSCSSEFTTLFRTLHGCYLGNITEKGNCEFKTFLGRKEELKKIGETEAMKMCKVAHIIFNKSIYDKSVFDIHEDDVESQMMIEEIEQTFPNKLLP